MYYLKTQILLITYIMQCLHYRLEGVAHKCFPLAPNKLVYPEIFPCKTCLYNSEEDLFKRLKKYLTNIGLFNKDKKTFFNTFTIEKYGWEALQQDYINILLDRKS